MIVLFQCTRKAMNVIGNGVVVHVPSLFSEIKGMEDKGIQIAGMNLTKPCIAGM